MNFIYLGLGRPSIFCTPNSVDGAHSWKVQRQRLSFPREKALGQDVDE
jgi:hypothetical protein